LEFIGEPAFTRPTPADDCDQKRTFIRAHIGQSAQFFFINVF
jgi:hypothetical protein